MKKVLYILLIALALFITGCGKDKKIEDSLNLSTDVSIMTIYKEKPLIETINKYKEKTLKEKDEIIKIVNELNNLKVKQTEYYVEGEQDEIYLYVLEFSGKRINIINSTKLSLTNVKTNSTIYYEYTGTLNLLDKLEFELNPAFELKHVKDFDLTAKITIKSNEKDATIEVTGKEEYINYLKQIDYIIYDNGKEETVKYVIMIGEEKIEVVDLNTIYVNGVKAKVYNSDLSFLEKIDFENTGWLPWV